MGRVQPAAEPAVFLFSQHISRPAFRSDHFAEAVCRCVRAAGFPPVACKFVYFFKAWSIRRFALLGKACHPRLMKLDSGLPFFKELDPFDSERLRDFKEVGDHFSGLASQLRKIHF